MQIIISKEDLLYAVNAVEKAVSNKNTLPSLAGIMITAEKDRVSFRATDLELAIECVVNAQVKEEGQTIAPGKKLSALARLLPECPIQLKFEKDVLQLIYDGSSVDIPCFSTEDFPLLPKNHGEIEGSMPVRAFKRLVRQVGIAAAPDELRPVFAGVYTEIDQADLVMVATDTHRLAKGQGVWEGQGEATLLIPNRALQEVARLAANDEDMIHISAGKNQIFFTFANLTFTTRMIVGQYPDYRQVIPGEEMFRGEIVIEKRRFTESLERAALISRNTVGKSNTVRLSMEDGGIRVSAEVPDEGRIEEQLPARCEGEYFVISYNVKYLLDVLRILDSERVRLRLTGANTPGIILGDGYDAEEYLYLLLPLRSSATK